MSNIKKTYYDSEEDIYWIVLKIGEVFSYEEPSPGIRIEFDKNSKVIGIEIENYSRLYKAKLTTEKRTDKYESLSTYTGETIKKIPSDYEIYFTSSKEIINTDPSSYKDFLAS